MILRNRVIFWQLLVSLLLTAAATIAALTQGGDAWLLVPLLGAALTLLNLGYTLSRYRKLAKLAARIDSALESGREVLLSDMREGEIAILASEVDKTLNRLAVANAELEHEKTSLADSLADISHQLRTPLTSLGLELELLRSGTEDAELRHRTVNAQHLLERVQWLVNALLKMARIESGAVQLAHERVSVASLVAASFEPLALSYDLAGIDFSAEIEPGAAFTGDAQWSQEALSNLLKNALEHTPEGGAVRVTAAEDTLACRIAVVDSGPGIAEADLPHVFERFWRSNTSSAQASEVNPAGIGLGLALARALVTAQGGTIKASNERDAAGEVTGARFEILFFKQVV